MHTRNSKTSASTSGSQKNPAYDEVKRADEDDWRRLADASERRKIRNRLAQRVYRRNIKYRATELERLKQKLNELENKTTAPSDIDHQSPSKLTRLVEDQHLSYSNEQTPLLSQQQQGDAIQYRARSWTERQVSPTYPLRHPSAESSQIPLSLIHRQRFPDMAHFPVFYNQPSYVGPAMQDVVPDPSDLAFSIEQSDNALLSSHTTTADIVTQNSGLDSHTSPHGSVASSISYISQHDLSEQAPQYQNEQHYQHQHQLHYQPLNDLHDQKSPKSLDNHTHSVATTPAPSPLDCTTVSRSMSAPRSDPTFVLPTFSPKHYSDDESHAPSVRQVLEAYNMGSPRTQNIAAETWMTGSEDNLEFNLSSGRSILHIAAEKGFCDILSLLLQRGDVDMNSRDTKGLTPLHCAALAGQTGALQILLDHGADISTLT